jgi:hypothetical protein
MVKKQITQTIAIPVVANTPWYKSKTVWVNALLLITFIITGISDLLTAGEAVTLAVVLNLVLRALTQTKLTWN